MLLLLDFNDRAHVLLFLTSVVVYYVRRAGLVALGAYVRLASEQIIQPIAPLDGATAA